MILSSKALSQTDRAFFFARRAGGALARRLPALLAVSALLVAAQIKREVDLVVAEVHVTDERGNLVANLKAENFRLLDDGEPQAILHFAPIEAPARLLVVVETSPAVYLLHRQHLDAAYALLGELRREDQVALVAYDESPRLLLPFSEDKHELQSALAALRYNMGAAELRLAASLTAALDWLPAGEGRSAVLLLSTGLDTGSAGERRALEEKIRATGAVVFAVALGGDLRAYRPPPTKRGAGASHRLSFERADRDLQEYAALAGGRVYTPSRAEEFPSIYRQIAAALRHQYSLGFRPAHRDGASHSIEVQVVNEAGRVLGSSGWAGTYRVHTRKSYMAPGGS